MRRLAVLTIVMCLTAGSLSSCGGDDGGDAPEKPTTVTAADLDKDGHFWVQLTPDLKDELVDAGKTKLGEQRPDGASNIRAIDSDELVTEIDKQYSNESKREATIYETYVGANDKIARETFEGLVPQLEGEDAP